VKLFPKNSYLCDHNTSASRTDGHIDRETRRLAVTIPRSAYHRAVTTDAEGRSPQTKFDTVFPTVKFKKTNNKKLHRPHIYIDRVFYSAMLRRTR